jgi:hypothetical protein
MACTSKQELEMGTTPDSNSTIQAIQTTEFELYAISFPP